MEFNLLKEFLESGLTQTQFGLNKNVSGGKMAAKLHKDIRRIFNSTFIDAEEIIGNHSSYIHDVKFNKENWLKAINAHEEIYLSLKDPDNRKLSDLTVSEFMELMSAILAAGKEGDGEGVRF